MNIDMHADHRPDALRQALESCRARFRNIIEKNADGVIVLRGDGSIGYVNPAATQLLGREAPALLGQAFGSPVVPGETAEIDIAVGKGEVRVAELRVVESEWDGAPARLVSLRDVTAHKQLEDRLRQTVEALAEADRRKDEFLAMLAHELRNPLGPILNAIGVMRAPGADPAAAEPMRQIIERQVRTMARLVDDLLDVSRITQGKIVLREEPVDLATVIARAVETARPLYQSRRQSLDVGLPDPPIRTVADPLRLEQVVVNLLNNAAKYSEPGSAVRLEAGREGDHAVVRVLDRGIGIAPEMLSRVFDLFTQVDQSLARSQGGLGIGLTLVRSLVQLHGGTVSCRSDGLGKGSEFSVRIPIETVNMPDTPASPGESPRPSAGGRRVLVVDDNAHSAESLALIIKLWGHETRVAYSGPEALEAAAAFRPEIALLDVGLPGMDGFDLARRMRALPGLSSTRLMAVTGYNREEDRRQSAEAGFDRHLVKPLDLDYLEALLAEPTAADRGDPGADRSGLTGSSPG